MRSHRGFTLIELLVVITIIVLLIALLLPTMQAAREAGKMSVGIADLRQIQIALQTYAGDNKESLPYERAGLDFPGSYLPYWGGVLVDGGYVTDPAIYWSPFRDTAFLTPSRVSMRASPLASTAYQYTGFGVNRFGAMPSIQLGINNNIFPRRLSQLGSISASKLMTMVEVYQVTAYSAAAGYQDGWWSAEIGNVPTPSQGIYTWRGAAARAYLDGHALSVDASDLGWDAYAERDGQWYHYGFGWSKLEPWYDMR